ncbi:AAA family ATPase [bacterium]|nr:AAA family ATPase [bacterium]
MESTVKTLQHIETEERMIAALLYDYKTAIDKISDLTVDHFTKISHKEILRACASLSEEGEEIEPINISQAVGGSIKVSELTRYSFDYMGTTNFVGGDFKELDRLRRLRELKAGLQKQLSSIHNSSIPEELATELSENLMAITDISPTTDSTLKAQTDIWADDLTDRYDGKTAPGIPTGYPDIDWMTGGLVRGNLIIIGARPAVGKTTFAMNLALNVVKRKIPVAFISLEMMSIELVDKLVSHEGKIDGSELKLANIPEAVFKKAISTKVLIEKHPLHIIDNLKNDLSSILHRARQLVHQQKVKVVVIDYLQLMDVGKTSENRNNELSKITRAFKQFAQRENVTVVLLSQLNRKAAARAPKIFDLRDSGAIEQDANIVILLHDFNDRSKGILGVSVAKNRAGKTGVIKLRFLEQYSQILNGGTE